MDSVLMRLCKKPSLGRAGGKPNPLNPPYQGDFPLNSPLIRGARGVKNDERWVSCTVSNAGVFLCSQATAIAQGSNAAQDFVEYAVRRAHRAEALNRH